ncbi:YihY/virulence factor BrkB family protein [Pseudooceanicola sp. LIPI14-2-Ac024]|uniref:YihY/virulence factor BrkB family protein n=1 Tax=Pseudooceanicola sp. LIPI14-2-Ac024 TaxID=3344875 RepID=UPI0035D0C9A9
MPLFDRIKSLVTETYKLYTESVPSRSAAALAYRGIFSLAPLLLVTVMLVSLFVGQETAQEEIGEMVDTVLDAESADMVEDTVQVMFWNTERGFTLSSLIGIGVLLYGASALFREAKVALHSVWGLPPSPKKGILAYIWSQAVAVLMVFVIGFFVLAVIVVNIALSLLDDKLLEGSLVHLEWISLPVSLLALAVLIGLMFRLVPDVSLPWSDLWVGALVTAVMMMVGIWGIKLYVRFSDVGSTAGTAGAIVVMLLGI